MIVRRRRRREPVLVTALLRAETAYWTQLLKRRPKASLRDLADVAGVSAATAMRRLRLCGFETNGERPR